MSGYKSIVFLLIVLVINVSKASVDFEYEEKNEEDRLLNEWIDEIVKKSGVETNFGFEGELNVTALYIKQDQDTGYDQTVVSSQGDIAMRYRKKCDQFGFGGEIIAKADSGIIRAGDTVVRSSFLFWEGDKFGTLKLGYTDTAANSFSICGDKVLVGYTGAGSGNLPAFYNASAGAIMGTGFTFDDGKAAKIVWLSPIIAGWSAGVSFTPDSRRRGLFKTTHNNGDGLSDKADFANKSIAYSKNIITGGLTYAFGDPDQLNAEISASLWTGKGVAGKGVVAEVRDVLAYNVGAMICYKNLKASLGYTYNGKSLQAKKQATDELNEFDPNRNYALTDPRVGLLPGADAGEIYSVGLAYKWKRMNMSLGYFKSEVAFSKKQKATADVVTMAVEYTFNRSLRMYCEYNYISTETCAQAQAYNSACGLSTTGKNKANAYMIGCKINL
ncbi:MAG: porin [Holosporaceae bacterium]|jgi:hypothetical protein|nr:porin [Holosporaceae bacterium]